MGSGYLITNEIMHSLILFNDELVKKGLVEECNPLSMIIDDIFYLDQEISDILGTK